MKRSGAAGALFFLLLFACGSPGPEGYQGSAPADAYIEGSVYPYYGCEGRWDRRFFSAETAAGQYKRRGQRQMLDIVEGRPEEAVQYCLEMLEADPGDLESLFNLVVARTQMGQLDRALKRVEEAVDKGLPFERFQAGPRDLLKPLYQYGPFQKFAVGRSKSLVHGPMLGSMTDRSVRIWVRTASEAPVQVRVSKRQDLADAITSETVFSDSNRDYTAVVPVNGLEPETKYFYDVIVAGAATTGPPFLSFTTYPATGRSARFSVAFGGGAGYVPEHERIWDVIRAKDPDAMLLLGDNVYIDLPGLPNAFHYYTYYRRQSRPEFRRLVAEVPVFAIWDDHDSAIDDVWLGPYVDKPPWKLPLFRQFRENWNNPAYGSPERPGVWFDFSIGDVEFFMLDGRFYRTNPFAESPTMLGPVQKRWLLRGLGRSDATFKVIVSPVPWALEAKNAVDTWRGFQDEREEIFKFLTDNQVEGVVLLSADRHRSDAWLIEREGGYPLYEFESSRLTNQHVHEVMPGSLFGYNEKQSFGLLTFDTKLPDPSVTYQVFSIDDELIETLIVKRAQLSDR